MSTYIVAPERCAWTEVTALTPLVAYAGTCNFFRPNEKVAVINKETGKAHIFSRRVDRSGKLISFIEHTAEGEMELEE